MKKLYTKYNKSRRKWKFLEEINSLKKSKKFKIDLFVDDG